MNISNFLPTGPVLFFILFFLAIYFKDSLGWTNIPNTITILFFFTLANFLNNDLIAKAKDKQEKVVGVNIQDTIVTNKYLKLKNNFYAFSLGGYEHPILGTQKGKNGVVLIHEDFVRKIDKNREFLGTPDILFDYEIEHTEYSHICEYFEYSPKKIYRFSPSDENLKTILEGKTELAGLDKSYNYVKDINEKINSLSTEINSKDKLIKQLTGSVKDVVQFASNIGRVTSKPYKDLIKTRGKKSDD